MVLSRSLDRIFDKLIDRFDPVDGFVSAPEHMRQLLHEIDQATNKRRVTMASTAFRQAIKRIAKAYFMFLIGLMIAAASMAGTVWLVRGFDGDESLKAAAVATLVFTGIAGLAIIVNVPIHFRASLKLVTTWEMRTDERFRAVLNTLTDDRLELETLSERGVLNQKIDRLAENLRRIPIVLGTLDKKVLSRVERVTGGVLSWKRDVALPMPNWRSDLTDVVKAGYVHFLLGKWELIADGKPSVRLPAEASKWVPRFWIAGGLVLYALAGGIAIWGTIAVDGNTTQLIVVVTALFAAGAVFLQRGGAKSLDLKGAQELAVGFGVGPVKADKSDDKDE